MNICFNFHRLAEVILDLIHRHRPLGDAEDVVQVARTEVGDADGARLAGVRDVGVQVDI